ncbi:6-phosphogluconate dehydrogenase C-terminal domain-like protein [Nemania abortiva]|nr:6-phosphogluconate dehydrogenase C-terminal domain-like protein [Nemania abortiva]
MVWIRRDAMRVAAVGLPITPSSALRRQLIKVRGIHVRLLQSSVRMQDSEGSEMKPKPEPQAITPAWLRRLLEDDAQPPKLYAWTPKNLGVWAKVRPKSGSWTGAKGRGGDSDDERRRIYILGVGNIGCLYAMCLSKMANRPPITLVVHRRELLERWAAEPGIELTRYGQVHRNADFDVEWWTEEATPRDGSCGVASEVAGGRSIGNIIIATKAADAVPQVDRIRRYLSSGSTVAFTQNGMCKLWPPLGDAYVRARFPDRSSPNWIACVTTHGVTSQGPFKSTHASPANALVGPVMPSRANGAAGRMGYLMHQVANAPDLDAHKISRKKLWVAQLEKLVVNAIINPLTAVLRCKNGELFVARDDVLPIVIDKLLNEASETLCSLIIDSRSDEILLPRSVGQEAPAEKPDLVPLGGDREQLLQRFSFLRLRKMVLDVGTIVAANTSSMLQDVRAGKPTEIDDFNGRLVDTAMLLNKRLRLPTHEALIALVKSQTTLTRAELCTRILGEKASVKL